MTAPMFQKPVEKILNEYADQKFSEEAYNAKNKFFSMIGLFEKNENQFLENIHFFHDWYLFERELEQYHQTPVLAYYHRYQTQMDTSERILYEALTQTEYSLFEFQKEKKNEWIFYDYLRKSKFSVENYDSTLHFEPGDIFQNRLIQFDQKFYFGFAFCFHPQGTLPYFKKKIKELQKKYAKDEVLLRKNCKEMFLSWLKMYQKQKNFKHVPVDKIYTD